MRKLILLDDAMLTSVLLIFICVVYIFFFQFRSKFFTSFLIMLYYGLLSAHTQF